MIILYNIQAGDKTVSSIYEDKIAVCTTLKKIIVGYSSKYEMTYCNVVNQNNTIQEKLNYEEFGIKLNVELGKNTIK